MPCGARFALRLLVWLLGLSLSWQGAPATYGSTWATRDVRTADARSAEASAIQGTGDPLGRAGAISGGTPSWLEPRGLSLIDLVGQVPEDTLHGMLVVYSDNVGLVVYESGSRDGGSVTVTAKIYPRVYELSWAPGGRITVFPCLGQKPFYDHMGSVVPASTLRVYDSGGQEVTQQITWMTVVQMGLQHPLAGSTEYLRYPHQEYGPNKPNPLPMGPEGLEIPANSGCEIIIPGVDLYPLTGVFTVEQPLDVQVFVVGMQPATFQSYIGVGSMGRFGPLRDQLMSRYGPRYGRIQLEIPAGATYFLLKFPAMPADAFAGLHLNQHLNANRPTGGTYRLSGAHLSTDLTFSAAFPLDPAWRDADQAPGHRYLPLLWHPWELETPEYVIPPGVAYNSCFMQGNCSDAILEQIYTTVATLEIIYLSVSKADVPGEWVPLKMAGPAWTPEGGNGARPPSQRQVLSSPQGDPYRIYVPLMANLPPEPAPTGCPCGWFDALGRMAAYYRGD